MKPLKAIRATVAAGCAIALMFLQLPASANLTNEAPDVPWRNEEGEKRPLENCGSIAIVNLLRLLDNDHDRLVRNNKSGIDDLKDRVEKALKDIGSKADWTRDDEMVTALNKLLKQGGYKGIVDRMPKYGHEKLEWSWIVDQWKNKKEKLCLLVEDGKDEKGKAILHWVMVVGVDSEKKTLTVTDPNTSNNSENINAPGGKDS